MEHTCNANPATCGPCLQALEARLCTEFPWYREDLFWYGRDVDRLLAECAEEAAEPEGPAASPSV